MPLLALRLTDDARLISGVSAVTMLPWFLLGAIGGAIVDRVDRRRLMIAGQWGRAVLVGVLFAVVTTDAVNIWWVLVVAFGLGIGEVFVDSAAQAAVPQLVRTDQLDRANSRLIAAITVLDEVVGVTVGAILFSVAAGLPFAVDMVTFALGGLLLAAVGRPLQGGREDRSERPSVRSDIAEGFRFLRGHRFLRAMAGAVAVSNLAGNIGFGVFVILVVDELGAAEASFGAVFGIGALGGLLGALVAERVVDRFGRRLVLGTLPPVLVATQLLYAVANHVAIVAAGFFVAAFGIVLFNVPGQSLRQAVTPEHLLGRVVASFRMFGMGMIPLGAIIGGVITDATNVRLTMVVAASVEVVAWILTLRALSHLPAEYDRPEAAAP